jgi:hypothetical protein
MTLTAFDPIPAKARRAVEREAVELLEWLRPESPKRELRWSETVATSPQTG